ncbi:hypothetical protein ACFL2O_09365 [Thermodesulfobacteriota bacterium]
MEKRIAYYRKKDSKPWPEVINAGFAKSMSKFGVAYFEDGSVEEKDFLDLCSKMKLDFERRTILKCTGKSLFDHPYHYLSVPGNRKINFLNETEYDEICTECNKCMLNIGYLPERNLILDYNSINPKNEFFHINGYSIPTIFIISHRLKEIMQSAGLMGYQLMPCTASANRHSYVNTGSHQEFADHSIDTQYYQFVITETVNNPPFAGTVRDFSPPCKKCHTRNGFYLSIEPCFNRSDLKDTDFQVFDEYISDNVGRFAIRSQREIISARALKILIDNKVRLQRYLTDPPIKYGVVEIDG